jgi:hypothetical protein
MWWMMIHELRPPFVTLIGDVVIAMLSRFSSERVSDNRLNDCNATVTAVHINGDKKLSFATWLKRARTHNDMAAPAPFLNEYFTSQCPASAPFFSFMGAAIALVFASEFSISFFPASHQRC